MLSHDDEGYADTHIISSALHSKDLSGRGAAAANQVLSQSPDGKLGFGHFSTLVRGGGRGLLSANDAAILKEQMSAASYKVEWRGYSVEDQIDSIRVMFNQYRGGDGYIARSDMPEMLRMLREKAPSMTPRSGAIPARWPVTERSLLDFEAW